MSCAGSVDVSCFGCVGCELCWVCGVWFLLNAYVRESIHMMCASVKLLDRILLCAPCSPNVLKLPSRHSYVGRSLTRELNSVSYLSGSLITLIPSSVGVYTCMESIQSVACTYLVWLCVHSV